MQISLFSVKRSFPLKYHQGYLDVAMLVAQVVKYLAYRANRFRF